VTANVFEIEAIGNTVCAVTGSGSSTLVTPSPRMVVLSPETMPIATPGMPCSCILARVSAAISSKRESVGGSRTCASATGTVAAIRSQAVHTSLVPSVCAAARFD
jgi:hypothetical protein